MQRLELTWINKHQEPRLEPRILLENPELRRGRPSPDGHWQGMLIHGDNLLALKALEAEFAGKVKCIYIDPPYNTGNAFEHYDDGIEHSLWLSLIRDRLKILRNLLAEEGSIWVTLDDNEVHYCKVMMDEVFGRNNFVAHVIWEKSDSPRMDAVYFSVRHDSILVYAKNKQYLKINRVEDDETPEHYGKTDKDGRQYYLKPLRAMGGQGDSREARPTLYYPLTAPDNTIVYPKKQDGTDGAWRWNKEKAETENSRIEWIKGKGGWTPNYRIYADSRISKPPETIWSHQEVGSNRTSKIEIKSLFSDEKSFATPKPERLIHRVLTLATNPNDLVLDSFLGSGTTAAVAHKMGRRWIGIELGEHARTHCLPRLEKVVAGTDQGGISKAVGWAGGGGFRFYSLAPSLLQKDRFEQWVIHPEYDAQMLAAAVALHEGYRYAPDPNLWWKQSRGSEQDYLLVTTQYVNRPLLDGIREDMEEGDSLLVCCKAYDRACAGLHPAIRLKKIPNLLAGRCEYGRDDYSLHIVNLPKEEEETPEENWPAAAESPQKAAKKGKSVEKKSDAPTLFE